MTAPDPVQVIAGLFASDGAHEYLGEPVTQASHMLQAAALAQQCGAPPALVAAGWAGITAVDVDPQYRRRGLGTMMTRALAAEAARRGERQVFLQVEEANVAARALYARCGFAGVHRYHYRVAPG